MPKTQNFKSSAKITILCILVHFLMSKWGAKQGIKSLLYAECIDEVISPFCLWKDGIAIWKSDRDLIKNIFCARFDFMGPLPPMCWVNCEVLVPFELVHKQKQVEFQIVMKKTISFKTHTKHIKVTMHTCRGFPWAPREAHLSSRLCVVVYGSAGSLGDCVTKSALMCSSRRLQGSWSSLAHLCSAYVLWYGACVQW